MPSYAAGNAGPGATHIYSRWASRAAAAVVTGLLIWMAIVWIHAGGTIIRFYSPLPYWDYWDTVHQLERYRRFDVTVLWEQHNEHRIVFPDAIFALDYLLFQGREVFPVVISALCYIGIWLILSAALYRTNIPAFTRLCAIILAAIVMGWQGSALLIASPFLLQWPLTLVASTAALFLLAQTPRYRHSSAWLAAVILCSVVSTYSSANGLLLWPLIVVAAFILHLNKVQVAGLALSGLVFIGLYFVGFHFSHDAHPAMPLRHPLFALIFIAAYLGMPFTAIRPSLGVYSGLIAIAAYITFVVVAWRRRVLGTTPGVVLLGFYLFCLLTAALTAAGRMDPQDPNLIAATAQRYIASPVTAWAALILTSAWLLGNSRHHLWVPALSIFALGFALTARSSRLGFWVLTAKNALSDCQFASLGFETGIQDPELMRDVFPDVNYVRAMLPILQKYHLSTFALSKTGWLAKPASSFFSHISGQREPGAVTAVYPIESGLLVLGWTDAQRAIWHPQQLIFLNEQKQIVGFGSKLPAGLPRGLATLNTPGALAWVGFVSLAFPGKSFSSYAIEAHGRALAAVGKSIPIPTVKAVPIAQVGPALSSIGWDAQGSWQRNGPLPVPPAEMPPSEPYYESWNGDDANTGWLTSSVFSKPAANCLIIPAAHGPSAEGLSIQILNADTGETAASVPMNSRDLFWRRWQFLLPSSAQHLRIIATDDGRDWGEWLAIGEPRACK